MSSAPKNNDDISQDIPSEDSKYAHVKTRRSAAAIKGAIWSAINSIVPTFLNSLVFIVSSRYLMPHDFGIVALAISVVSFATALAPAALGEALIQKSTITKMHLDTVFWICGIFGVIVYVALVGTSSLIGSFLKHDEIAVFIPIIGLKVIFDLIAVVPNALIARSMSFHLIAYRTIIATLLSSIICITLLVLGYGIWALAISQLTISIASCLAALLGAKWKPGIEFTFLAIKELFRYGVFASANRFLQQMNLDQLIIGALISPAALGIFNFARRLFQMLNDVIAGALTTVSHALLSSLQKEKDKVREAFLLATFLSSIVSFPAFVGLALIAGDGIPLIFGVQWTEAIWPTRWFCLIGLMSCIGVIQSSLINSQGKTNWWFYYQLCRQILTLSIIVWLYDHDITTIVMAIAIQTIIVWPVTLVMVSKIIKLNVLAYFRQFFEPFIASILMFVGVMVVAYFQNSATPATRLGLEIVTGGVIYLTTIYLVSKEKILMIFRTFNNRNKLGPSN